MPSPGLVGREAERAQVQQALAQVVSGSPCALLVTGPTGIGKTRLAREACALAADTGLTTLESRAHELSRDVAYAPVVAAFGPLLHSLDPTERARIVGDLPQLRALFSGLGSPTPLITDPALLRIGVLDALTRLTDRLSRQRPLLWCLDGIHVADDETRLLLLQLAAALPDSPVLLLLAGRDDEPGRDRIEVLGKAFIEATWQVRHLALAPLDETGTARLAEEVLGARLSPELAQSMYHTSTGRPLFVESLARGLRDDPLTTSDGGVLRRDDAHLPIPVALATMLRRRVAALGPDEKALVEVLAVSGAPLEAGLLTTVTGLPPGRVANALTVLERHGMTTEQAGSVDLSHVLLRDAVLTDLSTLTQATRHAELADALAATAPDDPRLAEHVLRAAGQVPVDTARAALTRAARRARDVGAVEDARRYLAGALALPHPADPHRSPELLVEYGQVCEQAGDVAAARAAWQESLTVFEAEQRPVDAARMHRLIGVLAWMGGEPAVALDEFAGAEDLLDGLEPGVEHGELIHARLVMAQRIGDSAGVARSAERLRTLATRLDSSTLAIRAHLAAAFVAGNRTDYTGMCRENAEAARILAAQDGPIDPDLASRVHDQISIAAGIVGDLPALRRASLDSLQVAQESGNVAWQGWPRLRLAIADLEAGDLDAALRGMAEAASVVESHHLTRRIIGHWAGHATLLVHRGRLGEARRLLERCVRIGGEWLPTDRNIHHSVAYAQSLLALAEGQADAACRLAEPLRDIGSGWQPLLEIALYGEACLAVSEMAGSDEVVAALDGITSCPTELPSVLRDWMSGLRALAEDGPADAASALGRASAGFERLGLSTRAAGARLRQAEALARVDPDAAVPPATESLAFFEQMGSPLPAQRARSVLRALGVTPSKGRGRSRGDGSLSARELEVARLVAAGRTNAEVATELFISPRTVSTHLDRMYSRLGVSSRTALTRYLADSGLLDEPE